MSEFPMASLTSDLVVVRLNPNNGPEVLLIKRGGEPFKGQWALPGGFVNASNIRPDVPHSRGLQSGETFLQAAVRELREETGVQVEETLLTPVGVYDAPGRDPRGRVVSMAFATTMPIQETVNSKAGDDAAELKWPTVSQSLILNLAFDHNQILRDGLTVLGLLHEHQ